MNILITTFSFPSLELGHYDGKFVLAEAIAYAENGAKVKVLAPIYDGAQKNEIIAPDIEVIRFNYFWPRSLQCLKRAGKAMYDNRSPLALIQLPFLLLAFMLVILGEAKKVDIIHAQWSLTALIALPAKWIRKTKLVMTVRGSDIRLLPKWLNRFIHKKVDGVIDCWGPQKVNIQNKKNFPAHYIKLPLLVHFHPSKKIPLDISRQLTGCNYILKILYVGRYVSFKLKRRNLFMDLIEAGAYLKGRIDFHLFFIGNGDDNILNKMKERIKKLHLSDYVSLLGAKTNVADYLLWVDIGLGGRGLNAVSQEYIVAGLPQIMPKEGNEADTIWKDNQNVFLVEPGQPDNLAALLIRLQKNQIMCRQIGKQSRIDMSSFVMETKAGGAKYLSAFSNIRDQC